MLEKIFPNDFQKEWVVYEDEIRKGIGKLLSYYNSNPKVGYSENSLCPAEIWDKKYTKSFKKVIDAVDYFLINKKEDSQFDYSKKLILQKLTINFPGSMEQEKRNELTSLVNLLNNMIRSQSSPKVSKNTRYKFGSCEGCLRKEKTC